MRMAHDGVADARAQDLAHPRRTPSRDDARNLRNAPKLYPIIGVNGTVASGGMADLRGISMMWYSDIDDVGLFMLPIIGRLRAGCTQ
jgi:hypothetical protein